MAGSDWASAPVTCHRTSHSHSHPVAVTCDMFLSLFRRVEERRKKILKKEEEENISRGAWLAQIGPPHLSHVTADLALHIHTQCCDM